MAISEHDPFYSLCRRGTAQTAYDKIVVWIELKLQLYTGKKDSFIGFRDGLIALSMLLESHHCKMKSSSSNLSVCGAGEAPLAGSALDFRGHMRQVGDKSYNRADQLLPLSIAVVRRLTLL